MNEKIKIVSKKKLYKLFGGWYFHGGDGPSGWYLAQDGETYIAVDNTKGEFQWEEFNDLQEAIGWLLDTDEEEWR